MSTGYEFPWERAAMRGDELPDGLDLADQMAFTSLRHIYFLYRHKTISRDRASAEKQRVRKEWSMCKKSLEFTEKTAAFRTKMLNSTEKARMECRKKPSPENALKLCGVIDGLVVEGYSHGN